jgi:anti-sigma factor ChrR (cupin superfamily)
MKAPPDDAKSTPLDAGIRDAVARDLRAQLDGDEALLARVRSRVFEEIGERSTRPHLTVRARSGQWESLAPGVVRKVLWRSGEACSSMIRLQPGTSFPPHDHPIDEECVILEGSLRIGHHLLLLPGDFHVGIQGEVHDTVSTETGALCFLRTVENVVETVV